MAIFNSYVSSPEGNWVMFTNFALLVARHTWRGKRGSRNSLGLGTPVAARRGSAPRAAQRRETRLDQKNGDAHKTSYTTVDNYIVAKIEEFTS